MHDETFSLRTALFGSFTAPGIEEAVADFSGCEPHATDYGGSILLWKLHGSWTMVGYTPALITSACRMYHLKTGRDLLLCEGEDHHMAGSWQGIFTCDYGKLKPDRFRSVFAAVNTGVACGHSAVWSSINKVELRDLNGDGMPDLALSVSVGQGTFPNPGGSCVAKASTQSVHNYRLDFLFQSHTDRFYPAPWSKAITDRLRAMFKDAQAKALKAVVSNSGS